MASGVEDLIVSCVQDRLGKYSSKIAQLLRLLVLGSERPRWDSFEWQQTKRYIGEAIAECICQLAGCSVYRLDMHGGEPSEGLGDKDIDFAISCSTNNMPDVRELEARLEDIVAEHLSGVIGSNIYRFLSVPNIVELHDVNEFLIKKYVEAGPPYVTKLC
ncbi:hypothetical protein [Hyperthermus butylicus]|uniref:Uncharacterized protein n=1 Tax=Hyperthermus butylicus (strain DSM 5456 / JCM 9403 / PLM1-5) TaxID=415426 RepID=A2BIY6_HYPBU|nr:hypothetical protein [Hyperthermus butylicus]ABM79947.1 hypothetical protein Hbut_0070 [Hyperthermus butylicus DSM 5456]